MPMRRITGLLRSAKRTNNIHREEKLCSHLGLSGQVQWKNTPSEKRRG